MREVKELTTGLIVVQLGFTRRPVSFHIPSLPNHCGDPNMFMVNVCDKPKIMTKSFLKENFQLTMPP